MHTLLTLHFDGNPWFASSEFPPAGFVGVMTGTCRMLRGHVAMQCSSWQKICRVGQRCGGTGEKQKKIASVCVSDSTF